MIEPSPELLLAVAKGQMHLPTIVCLCGSTRFMDAFQKAKFDETLAGRIVLTIGCDTKSDGELFRGPDGDEIKRRLDELHKRKIDLADEVLILNCLRTRCKQCGQWIKDEYRPGCECRAHAGYGFQNENYEQAPYIGESTRSELDYARKCRKEIRFLEPVS